MYLFVGIFFFRFFPLVSQRLRVDLPANSLEFFAGNCF